MTMNFLFGDGPLAELLTALDEMYRDAGLELARTVKAAKSLDPVDAKAALAAAKDLKAAFQLVMEERTKIGNCPAWLDVPWQ